MHRHGIRALLLSLTLTSALGAQQWASDDWLRRPVDDATFGAFRSFFTYDRAQPFETRRRPEASGDGIVRERVSFRTAGEGRVTARITRSARAGAGWLVFLHGGNGLGKDTPAYGALQAGFARQGWNVIALDLQHFGERRTPLLSLFTEAEKHDSLYNNRPTHVAWVTQTVKDAGRTFDFLVAEERADARRIALVGFSRGAQMAIIAGGAEPRFTAVVAMFGGHFDAAERGHDAPACPANYIGRIAPRPLLMLNGTVDDDFDAARSVRPLQRHARAPFDSLWEPVGHVVPSAEMMSRVTRWLEAKVPR